MRTSDAGIQLIKSFEGLRLTAYPDPKTGGDPWTIGFGHTNGVKRGDTITEEEADALLYGDLRNFEESVDSLVTAPLTQNEFDALVSFTFNLGASRLKSSTLLKLLNRMQYDYAAAEFLKWVSPGSSVEAGLKRRRMAERDLFLKG